MQVHSFTLGQVCDAVRRAGIFVGADEVSILMRSELAARVIDGVRVVRCPLSDDGHVYDWTMCSDAIRSGDVFLFDNDTRAGVLVDAWPTMVVGRSNQLHYLKAGISWAEFEDGKYAAAAAVARKLIPGA